MDLSVDVTGRGEPLVLIHGLATTRTIWRHAAPRLARSRQVFVLDVPGFGASRPAGRGFGLEAVADRMLAGLEAAGVPQPFDLVGHSMGAAIALTLAARHRGAVRNLVLVSPAGLRPLPFALAAALGIAAEVYIPARRIASPLAQWSWGRRLLMTGGVADGGILTAAEVRQLVGASRGARRIGFALTAVASADLRGLLRDLPIPVGAVWGTADRVLPPGGLDTVRALRPECRLRSGRRRRAHRDGRASGGVRGGARARSRHDSVNSGYIRPAQA